MGSLVTRVLAVTILVMGIYSNTFADEEKTPKKKKPFFIKAGETADRAWNKVKKAGKKVGEEVQEVFDPEDEDLQAKKKNKKSDDDED